MHKPHKCLALRSVLVLFFCITGTAAADLTVEEYAQQAFIVPTRFAGKEAVFKTFGAHPDSIRLDEIEILGDENGAPKVTLHGRARRMAEAMGASHVHISLSYDLPFVIAFAVMEKRDN